ncbi:CoA transferase [Weizmannia acidilactici]|uniref:CoA transferase n=1 Tax=Weizmannia acidilactici TaxID=2607726 RepID=A0A5J4JFU7_9BACI|nr:CaiB/BaiF CoA-transferase family protein [Weizmannia acidilactici]GER67425.1 CoA transferase [Weizmannia acidilactici]GER70521.1 CoA transferase [Weizmannia acidilactici]GER72577.1 CoA transferase [Weizmannia acidilactici]
MSGPLEGIKVVELSRTLAGPFCSMQLADMGADVIKIEQPEIGDETRSYVPPDIKGESCYFMSLNKNKKGMTLNLKTKEGQHIVKKLVKNADVLIENFRNGTMEKFGLGYDVLKEINPRLVYCAVSGFGRTGPLKDEPAYDLLMQGFGGLMSVTGEADGAPVKVGFSIVDLATGLYASFGVVLALLVREKTGKGQYVEASLLDTIVSLSSYLGQSVLATGKIPGRLGSAHPNLVPYQAFEAKDGYVIIAVPNDWLWRKMCDALGLQNLKNHPKYAVNENRVANREELVEILTAYTKTKSSLEIIECLNQAGVPSGHIHNLAQVLAHPQIKYREMIQEVEHPTIGMMKMLGIPIKLSDTPGSVRKAPPLLGENTEEVLIQLGYSNEDIENYKKRGII